MIDLLICIFWIIFFMLLIQAFFTLVGFIIGAIAVAVELVMNVIK